MILDRHRLLAASIAAVLFCSASCSAPDTQDGPNDTGTAAGGGVAGGGSDSGTSGARGAGNQEPGSQEAGNRGLGNAAGNQDPSGRGTIAEQRNKLLVDQYLANAANLRAQGTESGRQAARVELLKARELLPADERVDKALRSVNLELDLPAASATTFGEEQARLQDINEQRRRAEVMSLLDSGNQALGQQNYERAMEDARRALLNIELGTYVEWGDLEQSAQDLAQKARAERDNAERLEMEALRREVAAQRRQSEMEQQALRRARVDDLLQKGMRAFETRRFDLSRDLAFQAMTVDSTNQTARELHNASIKAARDSKTDTYYRQMAERIRKMKLEAEDLRIPQADILHVDPEIWERASSRRVAEASGATSNADDEALRKMVDSTRLSGLSFTAEDGEYSDVKTRITTITDIPIIITPEAGDVIDGEGLVLEMEVTAPITVANFLDQMVRPSEELAWTVKNGVVQITTKAAAGGASYLEQYDVRDLVVPKTVFLPPTIRDIPTGEDFGDAPRTGGEGEDKTFYIEMDVLVQNIQDATNPEYWGDLGTIDPAESGYLLVTANPKMHGEVRRFLEDLRRFATTVVTIESKFLSISQNYLQQIGVDFRGLGGSGSKGTVAQLDDITNGLDDNASRGLDNSGTLDPAGNPASGAFFNDGGDGDIRGRSENFFGDSLGRALSTNGGATAALVFLDDLELQMIIEAVEKREDVQEMNGQNLTVLNNERGHVAIINQTAYVRDFDVEVAQAAFIADPKIDVIQDGVVLDVKPTVSHDRKSITLEMQPTVAELVRPIPTFSTSLAGTTQPVTVQLPQLLVRSFATTVNVPDGGSLLIGGLREVLNKERRAEVPILSKIPLLSFFFKQEGVVDENRSLMVLVRASVTDVKDLMEGR